MESGMAGATFILQGKEVFRGPFVDEQALESVIHTWELRYEVAVLIFATRKIRQVDLRKALDNVVMEFGLEWVQHTIYTLDTPSTLTALPPERLSSLSLTLAWILFQSIGHNEVGCRRVLEEVRKNFGDDARNLVDGRILMAEEAVLRGKVGPITPKEMGLPVLLHSCLQR